MADSIYKEFQKNQSFYEKFFQTIQDEGQGMPESVDGTPMLDCGSLPFTEVTVNLIERAIAGKKKRLGKLDVNYASFILDQACLSPTSVILATIYLERLKKHNSEYLLKMSSCELFLASLIVASKFLFDKGDDEMVYNDEWATFANLDLTDLNKLERDFLEAIRWSCFVDTETFEKEVVRFEGLISVNQFMKRKNSMTYMEMINIFKYLKKFHKDRIVWTTVANIFKSIMICSTAYLCAVAIVLASSSLVLTASTHILMNQTPLLRQQTTNLTIHHLEPESYTPQYQKFTVDQQNISREPTHNPSARRPNGTYKARHLEFIAHNPPKQHLFDNKKPINCY